MTSAAFPALAADLRPCKTEPLPEDEQKRPAGFDEQTVPPSVNIQGDLRHFLGRRHLIGPACAGM